MKWPILLIAILLLALLTFHSAFAIPSDYEVFYTFDEGTYNLTHIDDQSGNGYNGIFYNLTTYAIENATAHAGYIGESFLLYEQETGGSADDFAIDTQFTPSGPFAISLWFKSEYATLSGQAWFEMSANSLLQFTKSGGETKYGIYDWYMCEDIACNEYLGFYEINLSLAITPEVWAHVVIQFTDTADNASDLEVWVDGVNYGHGTEDTSSSWTGIVNWSGYTLGINSLNFNGGMAGYIDNFRYYNRALNETEIAELAAETTPPLNYSTDTMHYWRFDGNLNDSIGDSDMVAGDEGFVPGLIEEACKLGLIYQPDALPFDLTGMRTYDVWFYANNTGPDYTAMLIIESDAADTLNIILYGGSTSLRGSLEISVYANNEAEDCSFGPQNVSSYIVWDDWNHFVLTFDGVTKDIYLNNQLVDSSACAGTFTDNDTYLTIGESGSFPFDNFIMLSEPYSAADVNYSYNGGAGRDFFAPACSPSWECVGYEDCIEPAVNASCDTVNDTNNCGESYTGDYSEFEPAACVYEPEPPVEDDGATALSVVIALFGIILLILSFAGMTPLADSFEPQLRKYVFYAVLAIMVLVIIILLL